MTNPLLKEQEKQKYYLIIFLVLLSLIFLIFGQTLIEKKPVIPKAELLPIREVRINFNVLNHPLLKDLKSFDVILPLATPEESLIRENPFLAY